MLYTNLGTKCDQQVTVVGRLSLAVGRVYRRRVLSSTDGRLSGSHSMTVDVLRLDDLLPNVA